jgi:hypothetical protein
MTTTTATQSTEVLAPFEVSKGVIDDQKFFNYVKRNILSVLSSENNEPKVIALKNHKHNVSSSSMRSIDYVAKFIAQENKIKGNLERVTLGLAYLQHVIRNGDDGMRSLSSDILPELSRLGFNNTEEQIHLLFYVGYMNYFKNGLGGGIDLTKIYEFVNMVSAEEDSVEESRPTFEDFLQERKEAAVDAYTKHFQEDVLDLPERYDYCTANGKTHMFSVNEERELYRSLRKDIFSSKGRLKKPTEHYLGASFKCFEGIFKTGDCSYSYLEDDLSFLVPLYVGSLRRFTNDYRDYSFFNLLDDVDNLSNYLDYGRQKTDGFNVVSDNKQLEITYRGGKRLTIDLVASMKRIFTNNKKQYLEEFTKGFIPLSPSVDFSREPDKVTDFLVFTDDDKTVKEVLAKHVKGKFKRKIDFTVNLIYHVLANAFLASKESDLDVFRVKHAVYMSSTSCLFLLPFRREHHNCAARGIGEMFTWTVQSLLEDKTRVLFPWLVRFSTTQKRLFTPALYREQDENYVGGECPIQKAFLREVSTSHFNLMAHHDYRQKYGSRDSRDEAMRPITSKNVRCFFANRHVFDYSDVAYFLGRNMSWSLTLDLEGNTINIRKGQSSILSLGWHVLGRDSSLMFLDANHKVNCGDAVDKNALLFGLEVELAANAEVKGAMYHETLESCLNIMVQNNHYYHGLMSPESDSSISVLGNEFVFCPMSPELSLKVAEAFMNNPVIKNLFVEHSSCGCHVHVSKGAFKRRIDFAKWYSFIGGREDNRPLMEFIAGRSSERWAKQYNKTLEQGLAIAREHQENDNSLSYVPSHLGLPRDFESRYSAVNICTGKPTYEVRIFKTPATTAELLKNIEFVWASYRFATWIDRKYLSGEAFVKWLLRYPRDFPNLLAYFKAKNVREDNQENLFSALEQGDIITVTPDDIQRADREVEDAFISSLQSTGREQSVNHPF